ncbi:MAG TPA: hypothetical protein VLB68_07690 [Pyrinomonadaceae bacterium]|nr:hypothetical protein [Pyrinomonadaceae bacterium]
MANDDRDIRELLKNELEFIEKGGYGRSVHIVEATVDLPGLPDLYQLRLPIRAHTCNECHLLDFVSPEAPWHRDTVPLHSSKRGRGE